MSSPFLQIDKQIYYVKIIIWEKCPLRCSYCFVDKENSREMSIETVKKLIDLLLYTPGKNKLLHFLWGEPLLYFDTVKQAVPYARKLAQELWKDLDITFCTSWIWFTQDKIDFIATNDIYLAWSLDGPSHIHNTNRHFQSGWGSFEKIMQHKGAVLSTIKPTHIGLALTVDSSTVDALFDSFLYLIQDEAFPCSVNIAPTDGVSWTLECKKQFILRLRMLSGKARGRCIWFYTEAFTNGDILFNPFVHKDSYHAYVVGNIDDPDFVQKVKKYIWCSYHAGSQQCTTCTSQYFSANEKTLQTVELNQLTQYRDLISLQYTKRIYQAAKTNHKYREYIEQAKNYIYV